jgi:phenylpropionate dioxygenase-like ring-hydroxylating dioxygenase large terminal subunit
VAAPAIPGSTDFLNNLRGFWHPVARIEDVTAQPLRVVLLETALVLFRSGQSVVALADFCIHRGTPLSLGEVTDRGTIRCGYHGWEYDGAGACVRIPARPEGASIPVKARTESYRTVEHDGLVWVALQEPVAPLPAWPIPDGQRADFRVVLLPGETWNSSAGRAVDNFLDIAHLPFVHPSVLATDDNARVDDYQVVDTPSGFFFERWGTEPANAHSAGDSRTHWEYFLHLPFTAHIRKTTDSGRVTIVSLLGAPTGAKKVTFFFGISRNHALEPERDQDFVGLHYQLGAQDRRMVEQQRPEEIPLSLREELHIRSVDGASMAYRRLLAELGASEEALP